MALEKDLAKKLTEVWEYISFNLEKNIHFESDF